MSAQKLPPRRTELLAQAAKARGKGRRKKAIAIYHKVLSQDGDDPDVRVRVARLLAEANQHAEAWESFLTGATGFYERGFIDKAKAVFRQAADSIPTEVNAWLKLSELDVERERFADAAQTLCEGSWHFRDKSTRPVAIDLLRRAAALDPDRFHIDLDLARLLGAAGEKEEALKILRRLDGEVIAGKLSVVRGAIFTISRSPRDGWIWLRTMMRGK